jgi:hypothetical protein
MLIEAGADVHAKTENEGETALFAAAEKGADHLCKILLDAGCHVNELDSHWVTPLMMAAMNGRSDMVKFLLKEGADRHYVDKSGKCALDYCEKQTQLHKSPECAKLLKEDKMK